MQLTEVPPVLHLIGPGKLTRLKKLLEYRATNRTTLQFNPDSCQHIFAYGHVDLNYSVIRRIYEANTSLAFLSERGRRCFGGIDVCSSSAVKLRLRQHGALQDFRSCLQVAVTVVTCKLDSVATAWQRYKKSGVRIDSSLLRDLDRIRGKIQQVRGVNQLLGYEGQLSKLWYRWFMEQFETEWRFRKRCRRPPTDPVNSLLSFGYTLMHQRVLSQLMAIGFEPALGALHRFYPGRDSLACDVMEPFRIPVVDRWALSICRQKILSPGDFETSSDGVKIGRSHMARAIASYERHWSRGGFQSQILEFAVSLFKEKSG